MPAPVIALLAIACASVSGVFFAFSTFVMRALGALPASAGIRTMQSINVMAVTPVFMTVLFGTAVACVIAAFYAVVNADAATLPIVAGAVTYFIGTIVVTIVFNVPLNNALARVDPDAADAVRVWARYRTQWTAWNHVRTVSGTVAAGLFIYALMSSL